MMFGFGREPHRHEHEQATNDNKRKPRNVFGKSMNNEDC